MGSVSEAEVNRLYSLARQCTYITCNYFVTPYLGLDRSEEISKSKFAPPTSVPSSNTPLPINKPPTIQEPATSEPFPNESASPLEEPFLQARAKNKLLYENYLQRVRKIKSQFSQNPRQMQVELSTLVI
jgi:hypothetical protein